jgi:Na+/melibiose symporter-like transporter
MTGAAPKRVSNWRVAAFAAPAGPLLALTLPTIIFLPHHFSTHLGIPLGVVSLVFFAARGLDILLDPLFGGLQDRTETSWGRRRIWIVASCPILMALIALVFLGLRAGQGAYVAGSALMAMYIAFAAMMIAHLGWAGELIPTYRGRTRVLGAVQLASMIGQTSMLLLAAIVVQGMGGTDADAVASMGWTLLLLLPLTTFIAVKFAPEHRTPPQPHLGLKEALRTLIENPLVRRVLAPDLLLGIAQGVSGTLFLFYFQFVLGFANQSQTLLAIYFIAGLA